LVPRDVASRAAKRVVDEGYGVGPTGVGVYLDFASAIQRLGRDVIEARYGNLFDMYERITGENPYETPMRIYPAPHYTMGGLWVDYDLQSTIPGCFVIGEANFSDHGANRLGASALMQGLADGYFVLPYTIADYLSADIRTGTIPTDSEAFEKAEKEIRDKVNFFLNNNGKHSVDYFHKKLGHIMWNKVGMGRTPEGLREAIKEIEEVRNEFWKDVRVPGEANEMNMELEKAFRVADFLELGQLMAKDALERNESCGGHFRWDHATEEGEAERDDANYMYAAIWEYQGDDINAEVMHKEPLIYENIEVKQRSYK